MMIVAKVGWRLAPSSFCILGIWDNLSCGGWYRYHDTCNMKACMCMDLGHDRDLSLACHLINCTNLISGRMLFDFFLAEVDQSSFSNSLVARIYRSRCC
jgi:hypothetical protein